MAEHLGDIQVEGLHTVALLEGEVGIARGLADDIHRSALALGNLLHVLDMLLVNEQTHALLTLVGYNLLRRECLVADRQLGHVYLTATLLNKFGEAVQMTC